MAVVRARSSPPYALIAFIFLTVIASGIAIWLAAERGSMAEEAQTARDELNRVRHASEKPLVEAILKDSKDKNGPSALAVAAAQIDLLKRVIEPSEGKSADTVSLDAQKALKDSDSKTLVARIEAMTTQLQQQKDANAQLQTQLATLNGQMNQARDEYKNGIGAKDKALNDIQTQLTTATAGEGDQRAKLATREEEVQKEKTAMTADYDKQIRDKQLQIDQRNQEIVTLNATIDDLKRRILRDVASSAPLAPAGLIVRATPGGDECYINLGKADRIMVGLTFSVHDPKIGIKGSVDALTAREDDQGVVQAAGKGGIEVLQVGDTESRCRITKLMPGQVMEAGDLLSNPVYQNNKNRKNHFVVIGDFDLDGDGVATMAERDRIIHLITEWGGVIDDKISPQTDYLLAGDPPAEPALKTDDTPGGVVDQYNKKTKDYQAIIDEAKRDSVPILNANRFLAMVGYYNTTVVK